MDKLSSFFMCGLLSIFCKSVEAERIILINKSGQALKFAHIGTFGRTKEDIRNPLLGFESYGIALPDGESVVFKNFNIGLKDEIWFTHPSKIRLPRKAHYTRINLKKRLRTDKDYLILITSCKMGGLLSGYALKSDHCLYEIKNYNVISLMRKVNFLRDYLIRYFKDDFIDFYKLVKIQSLEDIYFLLFDLPYHRGVKQRTFLYTVSKILIRVIDKLNMLLKRNKSCSLYNYVKEGLYYSVRQRVAASIEVLSKKKIDNYQVTKIKKEIKKEFDEIQADVKRGEHERLIRIKKENFIKKYWIDLESLEATAESLRKRFGVIKQEDYFILSCFREHAFEPTYAFKSVISDDIKDIKFCIQTRDLSGLEERLKKLKLELQEISSELDLLDNRTIQEKQRRQKQKGIIWDIEVKKEEREVNFKKLCKL